MRWSKASLFAAVAFSHVSFAPECIAAESEDHEPIRLEYRAHAGCPSESDMLRRISSYTTRWRLADSDEDARRFVLRIERRGKTSAGHFALTSRKSSGGSTIRREIEGEDCDHVATGLAVVVAIAIDPRFVLAPEAADAPVPEAPGEAAAPPPSSVLPDGEDGPAEAAPWRDVVPAPRRRTPVRRSEAVAEPIGVSVGARVELTGALSGVLPVGAAFGEVAWPPLSRITWLALTVRLGVRQSLPRTTDLGAGDISVLWSAGFVEMCPARLPLGSDVVVTACLDANLGVVSAEPRKVPGGAAYRAWVDYGAAAALRWRVHPNVFLELAGGVAVPVTRDRFRATPDGPAMVPPRAGGFGGLGGGWRF